MTNEERPNLLWIVMEDVSPRFGCYGDELARTPNIDEFATEARTYRNAFCTAPVCAPSRASLMTGMYPSSIGAHHMRTKTHDVDGLPDPYEAVPPHYVTAVSEYLRGEDYYATLDSKTDYQFGEPFTMWDNHEDGAGWWDDQREEDQPFFAVMTNAVTHESGMWDPNEFDPAGGSVDKPQTDPDAIDVPPYLPDTDRTRKAIARQYDNIETSDAWIGDLLDRLEADGYADDTIVMLTADHAEGLPRHKRWPYDSGTNVPLIVRWPAETDGGISQDLVSLVDLPATALSLAGIDIPVYMHGRPFLGPEASQREHVFATRDRYDEEYDMMRSVRDGQYRYVRNYYQERPYVLHVPYRNRHPAMQDILKLQAEETVDDVHWQWSGDTRPAEELYDLTADPHETTNLADDPRYRNVLDRLREALDDWRSRTWDRHAATEDETQMRNRMWPDGDQPRTATVRFIPNAPGLREREPTDGGKFQGPMSVRLFCPTQGASLAYTTDTGEDPHWKLYDGPIHLEPGVDVTFRAKGVRYGYAESDETCARFIVEPNE